MRYPQLTRPAGPWLHLLAATAEQAGNLVRELEQDAPLRPAARVVRGRKAATVPALFDEAGAALQFPWYFGENWDAFYDCLTDLSWLRAEAVVVVFAHADRLLERAPAEQVQRFATVLEEAVREWNEPDPPKAARPFHAVFQVAPAEEAAARQRWQAAGLALHRLT
jgi:RNAse (barnase) inhibitor barstar